MLSGEVHGDIFITERFQLFDEPGAHLFSEQPAHLPWADSSSSDILMMPEPYLPKTQAMDLVLTLGDEAEEFLS